MTHPEVSTYRRPHRMLFSEHTIAAYIDPCEPDDLLLNSTRRLDADWSARAFCQAFVEDSVAISGALPSEVWG